MKNIYLYLFILSIIIIFYALSHSNKPLYQEKLINETNIGFVKPEHRLLMILNSVSSGHKIDLRGACKRYIYNRSTITSEMDNKLSDILKNIISGINKIAKNDFYVKGIENVYVMVSGNNNQRYFIDFFIYDIKNYYTIRLISDIVILNKEIYINYLNVQTASNPILMNNYDVKYKNSGILFDEDMFHNNIDKLFDTYYQSNFRVVGISENTLEYTEEDLTGVYTLNSLRNIYLPASISNQTTENLDKKDLSGYLEMYLPQNQVNIKSPSFCDKYKIEWNKYGIVNDTDNKDSNCYVNNSASTEFNEPWFGPGLFNNYRTNETSYNWMRDAGQSGNIISDKGYHV